MDSSSIMLKEKPNDGALLFSCDTCFFGSRVNMWHILTINIKLNISICVERPKRMEILRNNWALWKRIRMNAYFLLNSVNVYAQYVASLNFKRKLLESTHTQCIHIVYESNYQQVVQQIFLHFFSPFFSRFRLNKRKTVVNSCMTSAGTHSHSHGHQFVCEIHFFLFDEADLLLLNFKCSIEQKESHCSFRLFELLSSNDRFVSIEVVNRDSD